MDKRFVQRGGEVTKPVDAFPVPKGLGQCGPQSQRNIFICMVVIYVDVPFCLHDNIEQAMRGQLLRSETIRNVYLKKREEPVVVFRT